MGLSVSAVSELTAAGVEVSVERGAGTGSGFDDVDYERAGACLLGTPAEGYRKCGLIVKVKEPQPQEFQYLEAGHVLFTYLHLAAEERVADALLTRGVTGLAYETLVDEQDGLPLLRPMSEVAGRLSIQEGARHLLRPLGGRGVLLGGAVGTPPGHVCVVGGGVVGAEAARMAAGLGAQVVVLDSNLDRLRQLSDILPANVRPLYAHRTTLLDQLQLADLVVGAVLLRGARAPRLILKEDLLLMKPGAVIVDVAIDQGGMCETSRPTSHESPTYVDSGVIHYCVTNMPGAVSRTSTEALSNATLPFVRRLALLGLKQAALHDRRLLSAINTLGGQVTEPGVAEALGRPLLRPEQALTGVS